MEHYFDNAATTRICDEAKSALLDALDNFYGNPSSTHTAGRRAKEKLEESREILAKAISAKPDEIVFTSCGSESDNTAIIMGAELNKRKGKHIISSSIEHDAVLKSLDELEKRGFTVTRLSPDSTGKIPVQSVMDAIREDTALISLMLVNNETGAVTDIKEICKKVKQTDPGILIHTDAVQGFMKVPFDVKTCPVDMASFSGHKIHAIKGVGALYIKSGLKLKPFIVGGGQESGRRAGTEALPQIAAFAAACKCDPETEKMAELKSYLIKEFEKIPEIVLIKTDAPHILSISMPGYRSEVLMNFLEMKDIFVSKSSACKQGKRSHVLEKLGLKSDVIDGALRIGISRFNTKEDADALVSALTEARKLAHR